MIELIKQIDMLQGLSALASACDFVFVETEIAFAAITHDVMNGGTKVNM